MIISGVIWKGDTLIDGVPETLDMLRDLVSALIYKFYVNKQVRWLGECKHLCICSNEIMDLFRENGLFLLQIILQNPGSSMERNLRL